MSQIKNVAFTIGCCFNTTAVRIRKCISLERSDSEVLHWYTGYIHNPVIMDTKSFISVLLPQNAANIGAKNVLSSLMWDA